MINENMTYQERLEKASKQVFDDKWRGRVSDAQIQHDDWCAINKGKECNCDPNILIFTPTGQFTVDRQGNAHLVEEQHG
jgi:hypothetical protein